MFTQIEITTVCNAHCFYCAQDTLMHTHMSWECFKKILQSEKTPTLLYTTFRWSYLENETMRYYFMIDSTQVLLTKQIQHHLAQKRVPSLLYTMW